MPVGSCRTDRRHDGADQLIGQRADVVVPGQALSLRRCDVTAGGLAVHASPLGCLPEPCPLQPTAEHLTHLNHTDLPESH